MKTLDAALRGRIEGMLGRPVDAAQPIAGGYTPAARFRVVLEGGASVFAKIGTTSVTSEWLRRESHVYHRVEAPFLAELRGWEDHPTSPILLLEDLSAAVWPPPWSDARVAAVRETIDLVHATRVDVPSFEAAHPELAEGWAQVERDPGRLLSLDLVDAAWLEQALPRLRLAESVVSTRGDALTHFDLRSDNLCETSRGVVIVDWSLACRGNPVLDLGFWLPSLAHEGGPLPEQILPEAPETAAWVSGFFAARAGLPEIPGAPRVRAIQRAQLEPALAWAARSLGLPPPVGSEAR